MKHLLHTAAAPSALRSLSPWWLSPTTHAQHPLRFFAKRRLNGTRSLQPERSPQFQSRHWIVGFEFGVCHDGRRECGAGPITCIDVLRIVHPSDNPALGKL